MRFDYLATLVGVLIAVQARVNGELAHLMGNPVEAALFSFTTGLAIIALIALFHPGIKSGLLKLRSSVRTGGIRWWGLFGGVLGGNLVVIQTFIVPLIGVAIFSVGSIAGQTIASLLVDRLGITGGGKKHITLRRVGAALLTILAVAVAVIDKVDAKHFSPFAAFLAVAAGSLIGIQRAMNGKINELTQQSFATSLLNFITGTAYLAIFFVIEIALGINHPVALPHGPWWIYAGGVLGVIYIAFAATIVQHIGVLNFTLFSVGGQLVASLILDLISPTNGMPVSYYLVTGILMTYLGVVVGGVNNSRVQKKNSQ